MVHVEANCVHVIVCIGIGTEFRSRRGGISEVRSTCTSFLTNSQNIINPDKTNQILHIVHSVPTSPRNNLGKHSCSKWNSFKKSHKIVLLRIQRKGNPAL